MTGDHQWRKSSRSQQMSGCIEISNDVDRLRDSKHHGAVLQLDLRLLVEAVKAGRLDSSRARPTGESS